MVQKVECSINKAIGINPAARSRHYLLPELSLSHATCSMSAADTPLAPGCSSRAHCHRAGSSGGSGHSCPAGGQAPHAADAVVLERDFPGVPQEGLLEGGKVGFVF